MTSDVDELFQAAKGRTGKCARAYSRFRVGGAVRTIAGASFRVATSRTPHTRRARVPEAGQSRRWLLPGECQIVAVLTVCDGDAIGTCCGGCRQRLRVRKGTHPSTQRVLMECEPPSHWTSCFRILFGPEHLRQFQQ